METLSEKQVEDIIDIVDRSNIKIKGLRDDLIDHLCCLVEKSIASGQQFESALYNSMQQISPNGLKEVDIETAHTINYKYVLTMKKALFILGFISTVVMITSIVFKMLHLAGAGVLLFTSSALFITVVLPLLLYYFYNQQSVKNGRVKFKYIAGYFGLGTLSASILFKVLHLPGHAILLSISAAIIAFVSIPLYLHSTYLLKGKRVEFISGFLGLGALTVGVMFKILHLPGAAMLLLIAAGILNFVFLPLVFYGMYKKSILSEA